MAGILGGGMPQIDPQIIQQLMMQMGAQQANPMARPISGEQFLSGLGQTPMPPGAGAMSPQGTGAMGLADALGGGQNMVPPDALPMSTDFAGVAPGLPNLPDNFSGFGFGQTAPQQFNGQGNLRSQLIEKLLSQIGGMPNMGGAV